MTPPKSIRAKIKNKIFRIFKSQILNEVRPNYTYKLNFTESKSLEGKYILVTGATGGIGFAISLRLAIEGATVGVSGRNGQKVKETIEDILKVYPDAKVIPLILDITDKLQINEVVREFASMNHGQINGLINNAGGGERERHNPLWNLEDDVIIDVIETNLIGTMFCSKHALQYMIPFKKGKIINLSSVMGMNGMAEWSAYSTSKAGIIGFTKSLALECGKYGICVNAVSPGMVSQNRFDRIDGDNPTSKNCIGRFGYTDEVASLISFLVSDESDYITGQNYVIDGGRSIGLK